MLRSVSRLASRPWVLRQLPRSRWGRYTAPYGTPSSWVQQRAFSIDSPLTDKFNRHHTYLRVSLTEKCNLRCTYCMPEEGVQLTPTDNLLRSSEIVQLSRAFIEEGVRKIRFTGGEPLVRRDCVDIIRAVNEFRELGLENIGMTTNAIVLSRKLPELVEAGLNTVNISLDTRCPHKFALITRRNGYERVIKAIEDAASYPELQVKVNCVVVKGLNDTEINDFVEMTRDLDIEVRFIEYMPFDGNRWDMKKFYSFLEMRRDIEEQFPGFDRLPPPSPNETAKLFQAPGHKGKVGFITSMSQHFCSSCNRLRITADGNLKVCLFGPEEVSLRDVLRGVTDGGAAHHEESESCPVSGARGAAALTPMDELDSVPEIDPEVQERLRDVIGMAVKKKKAKHAGMIEISKTNNRPMITIGG